VLYVITMGTQISGSEKRYRTAHEAAMGGIEVIRTLLQDQTAATIPGVTINYQASFMNKINATSLTGFDTAVSIDPNTASTYDMSIDIGNPVYRVYAKIVQTKKGNTLKGYKTVRVKTGVVPPEGIGGSMYVPTYYTMTILSQKANNPNERIRMDLVNIF
jgi:hypothetical protein